MCKFETHFYSSICQTRRILFAEHMLLTSSPSVCLSVNLPEIEFSSCNKLSCLNLKMVVKLQLPIAKQTWKKGEHNFPAEMLRVFWVITNNQLIGDSRCYYFTLRKNAPGNDTILTTFNKSNQLGFESLSLCMQCSKWLIKWVILVF